MPKFCPNCGEEISDKVKFCTECGVSQEKNLQPESKPEQPESSIPAGNRRSSKSFNKSHFAIAILIIAAVITLAFFVLNLNNSTAGTVTPTPPASSPAASSPALTFTTIPTLTTTSFQGYVTEVTPFLTITPTNIEYGTFSPITPVPEDLTCLIYSTTQSFAHNKTAIAFNLQNPPMYFKYNVSNVPIITRTKFVPYQTPDEITYTTIDPASFFEITVRDKSTGEIYIQDGYGKNTGYHVGGMKLIKRGDLLIEFSGNMITADVKIWVKPIGNFNDTSKFDYKECIYWI